jgi:hypothetical protein
MTLAFSRDIFEKSSDIKKKLIVAFRSRVYRGAEKR